MPIRPPDFFLKRNPGPQIYEMTCSRCGSKKLFELAKNYTIIQNPECDQSDSPEIVDELPTACPVCGGKLKKKKKPVILIF